MTYKNKFEILEELSREFGDLTIVTNKNIDYSVPLFDRDNFKSIGRIIDIFDDVGSLIARLKGFVPINGGNVVYTVSYS